VHLDRTDGCAVRITLAVDAQLAKLARHAVQVVGVIGGDTQLDQPAGWAADDAELLAAVGCGETGTFAAQPELGIVAGYFLHVGNADCDRR